MQMQMRTASRLVALIFLSACAATRQAPALVPGAPDCAVAGVADGLRVYLPGKNGWDRFSFQGGKLVQTISGSAPYSRIERNDPDVTAKLETRFPQAPHKLASGEKLGFPAARSPNARYWAAAVSSRDPESPKELVITDGSESHRVQALPGFRIETLAWSPQSDHLGVIEMNHDNRARTFKDLIAPHGVQYSDVVLSVYGSSGQLACQAIIVKDRYSEGPLIEWLAR